MRSTRSLLRSREGRRVSNNPIRPDETYHKWIHEIGKRFRQSQIKAAVKVNDEMLRFFW